MRHHWDFDQHEDEQGRPWIDGQGWIILIALIIGLIGAYIIF